MPEDEKAKEDRELVKKARQELHIAVDGMFNKIEGEVRCDHCTKDTEKCKYVVEGVEGAKIMGMVISIADTFHVINIYLAKGKDGLNSKEQAAMDLIMESHVASSEVLRGGAEGMLMDLLLDDPIATINAIKGRLKDLRGESEKPLKN